MDDDDYDGMSGPYHSLIIFLAALGWGVGIIIGAWLLVGTVWGI